MRGNQQEIHWWILAIYFLFLFCLLSSSAMPRLTKEEARKNAHQKRESIRDYIRNERDPIVIKWKALGEQLQNEEHCRTKFVKKQIITNIEVLPLIIRKFIGSLRKAVKRLMRVKGGTPYSIIRSLFMYWDADKKGRLSKTDLERCMMSLGIKATDEDRETIITHYRSSVEGEMSYAGLLQDLARGEPTLIEFDGGVEKDARLRFVEVADSFAKMPPTVTYYLEAFRHYVAGRMRVVGGTPQEHVMAVILRYDKNITGSLDVNELRFAAVAEMKLQCSQAQAKEIIRYYDRKGTGELDVNLFVSDVCSGVKSILHFTELSARGIAENKRALAENPFIIKAFQATPNKFLEKFKLDVMNILGAKVYAVGGSKSGWLHEAFRFWDKQNVGYLTSWGHVQGAVKRLGIVISQEDAECLLREYDVNNDGNMVYSYLIKDIIGHDPHFLADATGFDQALSSSRAPSLTSRAPISVRATIENFRKAADIYMRKSQGYLEPRDVLHGSFLRFDRKQNGRVDVDGVRTICAELGVRMDDKELVAFTTWFDTNGSNNLDYNELVRQLYGEDIATRGLKLPKVTEKVMLAESRSQLLSASSKTGPHRNPDTLYDGIGASMTSTMALGLGTVTKSNEWVGESTIFGSSNQEETQLKQPKLKREGTLKLQTLTRNLMDIESRQTKEKKHAARQKIILEEKTIIQNKLASIERQRKKILEEYRATRQTTTTVWI